MLLKNIYFNFVVKHNYLWHVFKVCKCPVHHIENRPAGSFLHLQDTWPNYVLWLCWSMLIMTISCCIVWSVEEIVVIPCHIRLWKLPWFNKSSVFVLDQKGDGRTHLNDKFGYWLFAEKSCSIQLLHDCRGVRVNSTKLLMDQFYFVTVS